jgi:hypothetical protein
MKKRSLYLTIFSLIFVAVLLSQINLVSSKTEYQESNSNSLWDSLTKIINNINKSGWATGTVDTSIAKIVFLIIILTIIYASFTTVSFPENFVVRIVLSIAMSFLATYLITPDEIFGLIASYSALGITISLFLPIMVLIFLTIVVAIKANPIGIFFSKILWAIYSAYIFLKGLFITLVWYAGGKTSVLNPGSTGGCDVNLNKWFKPIGDLVSEDTLCQAAQSSTFVSLIMIIIGLSIFYFGVIKQDWIDAWIEKEMRDSQITTYENKLKKHNEYVKANAKALDEQSKQGE